MCEICASNSFFVLRRIASTYENETCRYQSTVFDLMMTKLCSKATPAKSSKLTHFSVEVLAKKKMLIQMLLLPDAFLKHLYASLLSSLTTWTSSQQAFCHIDSRHSISKENKFDVMCEESHCWMRRDHFKTWPDNLFSNFVLVNFWRHIRSICFIQGKLTCMNHM